MSHINYCCGFNTSSSIKKIEQIKVYYYFNESTLNESKSVNSVLINKNASIGALIKLLCITHNVKNGGLIEYDNSPVDINIAVSKLHKSYGTNENPITFKLV